MNTFNWFHFSATIVGLGGHFVPVPRRRPKLPVLFIQTPHVQDICYSINSIFVPLKLVFPLKSLFSRSTRRAVHIWISSLLILLILATERETKKASIINIQLQGKYSKTQITFFSNNLVNYAKYKFKWLSLNGLML